MSFQIVLNFATAQEAAAVLLALAEDEKAGKPATKPAASAGNASAAKTEANAASSQPAGASAKTTVKEKTSPAASGGKATNPAPQPSPSPAPAEAANTSLRDKQYPETGIGDLINKFAGASKDNLAVAKQVLKSLGGATKGPEIKAEFYDAAHKAFTLLNSGTAADVVLAGLAGGEEDGGLG